MRLLLAVLIAATCIGCNTTRLPPAAPRRSPPRLCLLPPLLTESCNLPEDWKTASPADKAAMELRCKALDAAMIAERDLRLADCRAWFAVEEQ